MRTLASRILNLTCSSSACERNWSVFEQVHTKKRNRLLHDRMRDLVFVKFNSKLRNKRESKNRDPIEKEVDDVLADNDNEFITGKEPTAEADQEQEKAHEDASEEALNRASSSQGQAKRKRISRPRKKIKTVSLQSLMAMRVETMPQAASSSESESDKSPSDSEDESKRMHHLLYGLYICKTY